MRVCHTRPGFERIDEETDKGLPPDLFHTQRSADRPGIVIGPEDPVPKPCQDADILAIGRRFIGMVPLMKPRRGNDQVERSMIDIEPGMNIGIVEIDQQKNQRRTRRCAPACVSHHFVEYRGRGECVALR